MESQLAIACIQLLLFEAFFGFQAGYQSGMKTAQVSALGLLVL
jgi:hypothetical protein